MAFGLHRYAARRAGSRRAPMADINVTPLVDVMLVLLIVFMVTAPLLKAGVPVDLPESRAKALGEDAEQVNLGLTRDGRLFIGEDEVPAGGLAERLARYQPGTDGKLPLVTLRADKALDYGRVMAVMGELNRAGFNAISLVTTASTAEPVVTHGSDGRE